MFVSTKMAAPLIVNDCISIHGYEACKGSGRRRIPASHSSLNPIGQEENMKPIRIITAVLCVVIMIGCAPTANNTQKAAPAVSQSKDVQEKQLYTAYNIWRMAAYNMKCINYKYGHDILPAGTKVRDVDINRDSRLNRSMITFKSDADNKVYNIYFTKGWHPGKTIRQYRNLMFSTKNFEDLTEGMNEKEIRAIKEGIIVDGMNKNAVLVAYGYPPEHRTGSLYANRWIYWRNKFATVAICFDKNDRTIPCR